MEVNVFSKRGLKGLLGKIALNMVAFLCPLFLFSQKIYSISVHETINPSSAEFISQSIVKANAEKAECIIIELNTPGGLLKSTREIVKNIMKSKVPVVVYVSPSGSHAGSAGVFITMAAHIAAMAPGTNIGAAHPVNVGGNTDPVMNEKGTNDAAAFLRTIANERNRNIVWAEDAVRNSASLTEKEALENNVIDLVAASESDLIKQINARKVFVNGSEKTLQTANAKIEILQMGFFQKVLSRISDPNIAYIMMMLGFFGLIFELFSPGAILPGIVGVILLVLAFYSMSSMPVNYAGIGLIIFGIALFLLEIKVTSHGLLSIGGIISVLLGSMILFRTGSSENFAALSWSVIISVTIVSSLFFLFIVTMGLRAQRGGSVTGSGAMIGKIGVTINELNTVGYVSFMGERWRAESLSGPIAPKKNVIVKDIKGLTLMVEASV